MSARPPSPLSPSRFGQRAAWLTFAGILLSGPLGLLLVQLVAPQPAWSGVEVFAAHYHPVQLAPYALGFLLIGGACAMVVAHAWASPEARRGRAGLALVLSSAFATFIPSLTLVELPRGSRELTTPMIRGNSHPG